MLNNWIIFQVFKNVCGSLNSHTICTTSLSITRGVSMQCHQERKKNEAKKYETISANWAHEYQQQQFYRNWLIDIFFLSQTSFWRIPNSFRVVLFLCYVVSFHLKISNSLDLWDFVDNFSICAACKRNELTISIKAFHCIHNTMHCR